MKRILALAALVIALAVLALRMLGHEADAPRDETTIATPSGPVAEANAPTNAPPPTHARIAAPSSSGKAPAPLDRSVHLAPGPAGVPQGAPNGRAAPAPNPEKNVIEFEVSGDLAIAYGDLILGRVSGGEGAKRGWHDSPSPRTWETGEIPYAVSAELPNPERVHSAIQYFNANTPVRFVPYTGQEDVLVFETGEEHCYSYLGRVGGAQPLKLSKGCGPQEIIHEIMHALGFVHEQSRTDRDRYLEILWENIEEKYKPQFALVPESFMDPLRDSPFDYRSVMLYEPTAFARGTAATMRPRGADAIHPVKNGLSEGDLYRLRRLYPGR